MKIKIEVFSQYLFDENCKRLGLNDNNVDEVKDTAFISIIGTRECLEYYLDEGKTKHYFNDNHHNVLNLDFDDISTDVNYEGHIFKTMRMEQAEKAIDFIERMIEEGKTKFYIHCRAGMSRSRAFAEFISRVVEDNPDIEIDYEERKDYTTVLNHGVLRRLVHAHWKKHKIMCYSNDENYENELVNVPIKEIRLQH